MRVVNDISNELDNNIYSLGVYIDILKAFDTINYKMLLKMYHYGIREIVLEWFNDYLANRPQYVSISNTNSIILPIQYGVPQGSILGPLLFILFINDIINTSPLQNL